MSRLDPTQTAAPAAAETLPERIGPYPIRGVIGSGSMGMVYLGHDPMLDRPVAIKTIHKGLLENGGADMPFVERFKVEAQAAGRLNHRGIVSVYQFGEDPGCAFIAMEYVAGYSLRQYIARAPRFRRDEVLCLMVQLLDALHYAHMHGVIHRDIKPANLLVSDDGRLKITDFGIARIESSSQLTRVNAVVGSPGFIAPEQYTGGDIDRRVDIFAAGVVLYQLLTGHMPFGGTDEAVMYKVVYEEPKPLDFGAGQEADSRRFNEVLMRALAKKPEQRFASARLFRETLLDLAGQKVPDALPAHRLLAAPTLPVAGRHGAVGSVSGTLSRMGPGTRSPGFRSSRNSLLDTVPEDQITRLVGDDAPTQPSQFGPPTLPTGESPTLLRRAVPAGWTADALGRIERDLARLVGPVARVLVHRGAQKHANAEDLRLALSTAISNEMERERFIQGEIGSGFGRSTQPGGLADGSTTPGALDGLTTGWGDLADGVPARSPATGAQAPVRADDPDRVTAVLVRQLGPIAKVIVKRAAANAMTRGQLVGATLKQCTAVQDLITLEAELWKVLNQGGEATA